MSSPPSGLRRRSRTAMASGAVGAPSRLSPRRRGCHTAVKCRSERTARSAHAPSIGVPRPRLASSTARRRAPDPARRRASPARGDSAERRVAGRSPRAPVAARDAGARLRRMSSRGRVLHLRRPPRRGARGARGARARRGCTTSWTPSPGRAAHLYIVGDLFDFWFEYRTAIPRRHFATLARAAPRCARPGVADHLPRPATTTSGSGRFLRRRARASSTARRRRWRSSCRAAGSGSTTATA